MSEIERVAAMTDEDLEGMVARARDMVSEAVGEGRSVGGILQAVHRVAEVEAKARAMATVRRIVKGKGSNEEKRHALVIEAAKQLAYGADDAWSGRCNDLARVAFDASRKFWGDIVVEVQFE